MGVAHFRGCGGGRPSARRRRLTGRSRVALCSGQATTPADPHERAGKRAHRMAGRRERPHRRCGAACTAPRANASVDAGRTRTRARQLALGAGRTVPATRRPCADAVPGPLAHAAGHEPARAAVRRWRTSPRKSATRPTPRSAARSGARTACRQLHGGGARPLPPRLQGGDERAALRSAPCSLVGRRASQFGQSIGEFELIPGEAANTCPVQQDCRAFCHTVGKNLDKPGAAHVRHVQRR